MPRTQATRNVLDALERADSGSGFFTQSALLQAGGELIIDASSSSTGAAEIHTFATEAAATVSKDVNANNDGTFETTIEIVSVGASIHSQKNKIEVSSTEGMRIRITNDSGNPQGVHVTGIEVQN